MGWTAARWGSAIALVSLVPGAAALVPMQGAFEVTDTLHLEGLLVPSAESGAIALVQPSSPPDSNTTIIHGEKLHLILFRWTVGPAQNHLLGREIIHGRDAGVPNTVTAAELRFLATVGANEMLVNKGGTGPTSARLEAHPAACDLREPTDDWVFPQAPDAANARRDLDLGRGPIEATCSVGSISLHGPGSIEFYGADLWLQSAEDQRLIRTGTFEEPIVDGSPVTRTVTQILQVYAGTYVNEKPLDYAWPEPANVRLASQGWEMAGHLEATHHRGNLSWGVASWNDDVDAFEADGTFRVTRAPTGEVRLTGETLDGPTATSSSFAAFAANPWLVAAAAAGGIALLAFAARGLWALFTRLQRDRLLDHPRRAMLHALVREEPGITATEASRRLGWPRAPFSYHLQCLVRGGHAKVHRIGGRTALFATAHGLRGQEDQVAILRRDMQRRAFDVLFDCPGLDQRALSHRLGRSQAQVSRLLASLVSTGTVRAERHGRRTCYYASSATTHASFALEAY